jgi:hypothetical protein
VREQQAPLEQLLKQEMVEQEFLPTVLGVLRQELVRMLEELTGTQVAVVDLVAVPLMVGQLAQ